MKKLDTDVFAYSDYKLYMKDKFYTFPHKGHGLQVRIAEICSCNPSYISQVLNGKPHLTLEQAIAIADWLGLSKLESKFFLTLVQIAKAGSTSLKKMFQEEATEIKTTSLSIKNRVKTDTTLSTDDQAIYYSDWSYAAIHVGVTIPSLRTVDKLAEHFQFSMKKVLRILKFLSSAGLVKQEGGIYLPTNSHLHLPDASPMINKHHTNWRLKALQNLDEQLGKEVHYSAVVSLSRKDYEKLQGTFLKVIEDFNSTIRPSPEEELACINLDFFKI